jgi:hypothetical protein
MAKKQKLELIWIGKDKQAVLMADEIVRMLAEVTG